MFNCEKLNVVLRIEQNTQTRITNRNLNFGGNMTSYLPEVSVASSSKSFKSSCGTSCAFPHRIMALSIDVLFVNFE